MPARATDVVIFVGSSGGFDASSALCTIPPTVRKVTVTLNAIACAALILNIMRL